MLYKTSVYDEKVRVSLGLYTTQIPLPIVNHDVELRCEQSLLHPKNVMLLFIDEEQVKRLHVEVCLCGEEERAK